mgnify:CR=1 FL=1
MSTVGRRHGADVRLARLEHRYRRLLLAPTEGSAAFYRRAGFVPVGADLLTYDVRA